MTEKEIIVMWSHATSWIIYAKKMSNWNPPVVSLFFHLFFYIENFKHHEVAITDYHKTRMIMQQSN